MGPPVCARDDGKIARECRNVLCPSQEFPACRAMDACNEIAKCVVTIGWFQSAFQARGRNELGNDGFATLAVPLSGPGVDAT